jgi:acyl-CoA hydrolase
MSEINFINPAFNADIIEIGAELIGCGRTSITLRCEVRVKDTDTKIVQIDKVVFVHVDQNGRPKPHNMTLEKLESEES